MPVRQLPTGVALAAVVALAGLWWGASALTRGAPEAAKADAPANRSPVDVAVTPDGKHLVTVNQTANTVSLVDVAAGKVVAEMPCGERPSAVALTPAGDRGVVSGTYSGDVTLFTIAAGKLSPEATIRVGFEPRGVAVAPDGTTAYVALTTAHAVAVLDLTAKKEVARIDVGRWPRYLALTGDGKRLAVGVNGDGGVAVVDTQARQTLYVEDFAGLNLGQMQTSKDGKHVYFPWMVYGHNPITSNNIKQGWVLASRVARVRLDGKARREAIALDPRGMAIADPHGLALSPDEKTLVCAASGTHELLVFRLPDLPFQDYGGPGDHIHPDLLKDADRFHRIPLGGRPMGVAYRADGKAVYVANYLLNAIQEVDLAARKVVRTIDLGGAKEPTLARKGEAIFYDGARSLDQWYSCHSCHYEGHANAVAMDTRNDGRFGNFKAVLSLRNADKTGPWFWHGWETDFDRGVAKSVTDTMLGKEPSPDDVKAVAAFVATLRSPPNPHRTPDGGLSDAAKRGEAVFAGEKAACARCHSGPLFTDGKVHRTGLERRDDAYSGYNPPSLLGVHDRVILLHDGRSKSLHDTLTGPHSPPKVTGKGDLTEQELTDLIAYLKSL